MCRLCLSGVGESALPFCILFSKGRSPSRPSLLMPSGEPGDSLLSAEPGLESETGDEKVAKRYGY